MTITRTDTTAVLASTTNAQSYATAAADPPGNALLLAWVLVCEASGTDPSPVTVANSPWGLTWNDEGSTVVMTQTAAHWQMTLFSATTTSDPGSDTFDISVAAGGGGNQTGCLITVTQYVDDSGSAPTLVQAAVDTGASGTAVSVDTLSALGASSWVEMVAIVNDQSPLNTPDTGWIAGGFDQAMFATPSTGLVQIHSNGTTSDASPSTVLTSNEEWIAIAAEIAQPAAPAAIKRHLALLGVG